MRKLPRIDRIADALTYISGAVLVLYAAALIVNGASWIV